MLSRAGFDAFLIGEHLMKQDSPGDALRSLLERRDGKVREIAADWRGQSSREIMVRVKICGITNWTDARLAVKAGADALGFNFYGKSPRYIEPNEARPIATRLPRRVFLVGVFVNASEDDVLRVARNVDLNRGAVAWRRNAGGRASD